MTTIVRYPARCHLACWRSRQGLWGWWCHPSEFSPEDAERRGEGFVLAERDAAMAGQTMASISADLDREEKFNENLAAVLEAATAEERVVILEQLLAAERARMNLPTTDAETNNG